MEKVFRAGYAAKDSFTDDFLCTRDKIIQDVNSQKFRSDEFTNIHDGKHIVFSGCSNTFGVGLEKEEGWAWKTYQKIIKDEKCSGFFNLGAGGIGIMQMVIHIFKYCKQNGNPDVIFMNLSNQNRSFYYIKELDGYGLKFNDEKDKKETILHNFQYYFMLEQYCRSNNIKLYSITWDFNSSQKSDSTHRLFQDYKFKTFYGYSSDKLQDHLIKSNNKNDKYFLKARDGRHQGTGYNDFWSDFVYNIYKKDNDDKKN